MRSVSACEIMRFPSEHRVTDTVIIKCDAGRPCKSDNFRLRMNVDPVTSSGPDGRDRALSSYAKGTVC